jgi:thymidylate synthase
MVDKVYLDLVQKVLKEGETRSNRTGIDTLSIFGEHLKVDISEHLAALTCKKVVINRVKSELIWFLQGSTNVEDLKQLDPRNKIWDGNSSKEFIKSRGLDYEEGIIGPTYGHQWRYSGYDYNDEKFTEIVERCNIDDPAELYSIINADCKDQIRNCINLLLDDPDSRRIILNSWIPSDIDKMCLPPCHLMVQFYVRQGKFLDAHLYQRSADLFLGVPFNLLSYSMLVWLLAELCGYRAGMLYTSYGDVHIYSNHIGAVLNMLENEPTYGYPTMKLSKLVEKDVDSIMTFIDNMGMKDIIIEGYKAGPYIPAPMAV